MSFFRDTIKHAENPFDQPGAEKCFRLIFYKGNVSHENH